MSAFGSAPLLAGGLVLALIAALVPLAHRPPWLM